METLQVPIINIQHLKNTIHLYKYHVSDVFLDNFPYSEIEKANIDTNISVEKSETILRVNVIIEGFVTLVCDRSLDEFDHKIEIKENIVYQFAEKTEWIEDNLTLLGYDTTEIDLSQLIYELIQISIPMKKIHPRFDNETYEENEEGEMLIYAFSTDGVIEKIENTPKIEIEGDETDPRWAELKKILENKN
jgi:uncharacterized protein